MTNIEPKIIDNDNIDSFYEKGWYYNLSDTLRYLLNKIDINQLNIVEKDSNINIKDKKYYRDGKCFVKKYINTEDLIKIIWKYDTDNTVLLKRWMASVIKERLNEIAVPSIAIDRLKTLEIKKGKCYKYMYKMEKERPSINILDNQQILNEEINNYS